MLKYLKIKNYGFYATIIIGSAALLRIILIALGWPLTNSDEGMFGLMGMDILYRGARPSFLYGYNYMGTLESYLGALYYFLLGGPSLFALRLSVITFVVLFLICMYFLTSLLYSRPMALFTLLLLSVGSAPYLMRQTIATGGSSQTLFFGSLAFLLAILFARSYRRTLAWSHRLKRLALYGLWGVVLGLGIWSDMVVVPIFAMAALVVLIFCWRELLWAWIGVVPGVLIGMIPSLAHSIKNHTNPLFVLFGLFSGSGSKAPRTLDGILQGIKGTLEVSLSTATGYPFCPVIEVPGQGENTVQTPACVAGHLSWSLGYLILLAAGMLLAVWGLRAISKQRRIEKEAFDEQERHHKQVQYVGRLAMGGIAVMALAAYAFSSAPVGWPGYHARYLISLLVATPAIIFPLWLAASNRTSYEQGWQRLRRVGSRMVLGVIYAILLLGTVFTFSGQVPVARADNQQRAQLIQQLLSMNATHIYTDYWTCYNLAFETHERIICGILNKKMKPSHNRMPNYYEVVHADPRAAYVYPINYPDLPIYKQHIFSDGRQYRQYQFSGYIVYQPIVT